MCVQLTVVVFNHQSVHVFCLLCNKLDDQCYDQNLSQTFLAETAVVVFPATALSLREYPAVLYITLSQALPQAFLSHFF